MVVERFIGGCGVRGFCSIGTKIYRRVLPRGNRMIPKRIVMNTSSRAYARKTLNTFSANVKSASVTVMFTRNGL